MGIIAAGLAILAAAVNACCCSSPSGPEPAARSRQVRWPAAPRARQPGLTRRVTGLYAEPLPAASRLFAADREIGKAPDGAP